MTATFPGGVKVFPLINPGDPIVAATQNAQQEEIVAIETEYRRMGLQNLADPNADRVLFWDESAGALQWLTLGTGLTITGTTIKPAQPQFYPLTTPLGSTSWDGDTKTTSDRAIVDLSTVFGVPDGVKAVLMGIQTQADAVNEYIRFGPDSTYNYALTCRTPVASQIAHAMGIVPCDSNGDVYCYPSGTIENVYVYIWGYWL